MTTRSESARTLQAFATDVAAELRMKVTKPADDENPSGATIAGRDRVIHFYKPAYPANSRVTVTGQYPNWGTGQDVYVPRELKDPKITVGIDRDPAAVARDIERRLYPGYDKRRAHIVTAMAEGDAARASQLEALALIANSLGVPVPAEIGRHNGERITEVYAPVGGGDNRPWGDFKANSDGSWFTIELKNVPTETAEQIAALIRR